MNRKLNKTIWEFSLQELALLFRRRLSKHALDEFNDRKPCVFVLSTGRVGSETMRNLLALSKNVFVFHEPRPELFSLSKSAYMLRNEYAQNPFVKKALLEGFWVARRDLFRFVKGCNRGYVETGPDVTFLAEILAEALPYTRFIHLVRNPYDVIISAMRRKWYAGNVFDPYRIQPVDGTEDAGRWAHFSAFEKNVWLWTETNRWISRFMDSLPENRKLLVHSEDAFAGDRSTLARLFQFIDDGFYPPENKIQKVLGMKSNAQKAGNYAEAAKLISEQNDFLIHTAGEVALQLGFDLSQRPVPA